MSCWHREATLSSVCPGEWGTGSGGRGVGDGEWGTGSGGRGVGDGEWGTGSGGRGVGDGEWGTGSGGRGVGDGEWGTGSGGRGVGDGEWGTGSGGRGVGDGEWGTGSGGRGVGDGEWRTGSGGRGLGVGDGEDVRRAPMAVRCAGPARGCRPYWRAARREDDERRWGRGGRTTGASGGAMRRPCERMPAMLESREPCHSSWRLWSALNGLKRFASPSRAAEKIWHRQIPSPLTLYIRIQFSTRRFICDISHIKTDEAVIWLAKKRNIKKERQ